MNGSSKALRPGPMTFAAVLVIAGALSIGLAACGSGSSTDSTQSASDVSKKEAGIRGTRLDVINQDSAGIDVKICGDGNCRNDTLQPGESNAMAAGQVDGSIKYQDGYSVEFAAVNPVIGAPYIELTSAQGYSGRSQKFTLDEDETQQVSLDGYAFGASRSSDTDYKNLALRVQGKG